MRRVTVPPGTTSVTTSPSSSASQVRRSRLIDSSSPARTAGSRLVEGAGGGLDRHLERVRVDAVEPLRQLQDRLGPAVADGVEDRAHDLDGALDVGLGAGHDPAVVGMRHGAVGPRRRCLTPEVDALDHAASLGAPPRRPPRAAAGRDGRVPWPRGCLDAHLPVEHGRVPGHDGAAARLRGALPRDGPAPARHPRPRGAAVRRRRDPRGLRDRRPRGPLDVPHRLRRAARRGRGVRRRPLRHRRRRPAPDAGPGHRRRRARSSARRSRTSTTPASPRSRRRARPRTRSPPSPTTATGWASSVAATS